ncbi:MAG: hypothetical protein HY858_04955 [Candidatus Solibacter usitatus]|nr:hypothetical protein [Candidatus Solibacter usitatus]
MRRRASQGHADAYNPDTALRQMRVAVAAGRYQIRPRALDRLLELGVTHQELPGAVEEALAEITLGNYKEPDRPFDPPGHGFVWQSKRFGRLMYLKFRLEGRKPVCWLYSLHEADYQE